MSGLVLDTNIVSYIMRGDSRAGFYRRHLEGQRLGISFTTVGELYEGAFRDNWGEEKLAMLAETLRNYIVIPASARIARLWGEVRAVRRRQPISENDAWIAATALAYECPLVTHNAKDFVGIPDLEVITEQEARRK